MVLVLAGVVAAVYPSAREYYDRQRAPEVDIVRATQIASASNGGSAPVPVLVATGYVVARRSSDVGVKAADPRLQLSARREVDYYAEQSQTMTTVIRVFGTFVTLILSIGAMFGATNTMYAAVAYRTREIGTLRPLGFSRLRIVTALLAESVALALVGRIIGCVLALPVHGLSTGTTNTASFSEVAFKFRITPALLAGGLVFAALMGAVGGLLPAIRAARIPVARALREI